MDNTIRIVRTEAEYKSALTELQRLMEANPQPGSKDAEALDLLSLVVRDFESKQFSESVPSPIEAIRFRMEQQGLSPRDLVPFLGSRSKVSEILAGKRPLTLAMIRALHQGLGIPARILLRNDPTRVTAKLDDLDWSRFPLLEMSKRGWIKATLSDIRDRAEELMTGFLAPMANVEAVSSLYRQSAKIRSARSMDVYALTAWTARVVSRAVSESLPKPYVPGIVDRQFLREVAQLSWSDSGPLLAREFLANNGIYLVIEPHLPRTYVDGAALLVDKTQPVIALSVRHDRVDNFWYSLMHELAHVSLHLDGGHSAFVDDLDAEDKEDPREKEADQCASEALIPEAQWKASPARVLKSPDAADHLAKKLKIHTAIVAGRMRHEARNYRMLGQLVGHGKVRRLFSDVRWDDADVQS